MFEMSLSVFTRIFIDDVNLALVVLVIYEFYDGITARGICHKEMIVTVIIRYTEVISVQNLESFIYRLGMIQHHA